MAKIALLNQNLINMIAAGEVIERPASVVKELVENSIDSGATKIDIAIENGGKRSISVVDDGSGINNQDLQLAFEIHSTSKIKTSDDLLTISTMGFRGEALASIGSVSSVKIVSKPIDQEQAYTMQIDCGEKSLITPSSGIGGTTIEVRDLFYKIPARAKFLKTDNTEAAHITECFTRIALANSNIEFCLIKNGKKQFHLPANQSIIQRIAQLFNQNIADNILATNRNEKQVKITAFVGKPQISRTNSKMQYIFLNNRFIRDKTISHAIKEAYRSLLEVGRFATIFLFIEMSPKDFDVNVHPAKLEIRFYNSNLLHSQIMATIKQKLLSSDLDTKGNLDIAPDYKQNFNHQKTTSDKGKYNDPAVKRAMDDFFAHHQGSGSNQQQQKLNFNRPTAISNTQDFLSDNSSDNFPNDQSFIKPSFLQIHDSYIVTQTENGFSVIDQHALHERIMYHRLKKQLSGQSLQSQMLLIPESVELTHLQVETVKQYRDIFKSFGIEIEFASSTLLIIQSFPSILAKAQPCDFVRDLLDILQTTKGSLSREDILDEIIKMASCKAAIKAGQKLSDGEITQLLNDKNDVELGSTCPHGRPTIIDFSLKELNKQFKRT